MIDNFVNVTIVINFSVTSSPQLMMLDFLNNLWYEEPSRPNRKAVLVTGCDSGLGLAMAKRLEKIGFIVIAACLSPGSDGYKELNTKKIRASRMRTVLLDITQDDSVEKCRTEVDRILSTLNLSGIWCLINNAGVLVYGDIDWTPMDRCKQMIDINLKGTLRVTKVFLDQLIANRGRLIFVTSIAHSLPLPGCSIYSATKSSLEVIAESLRLSLASHGVKVIAIRPGDYTKVTNILSKLDTDSNHMWHHMDQDKRDVYADIFYRFYRGARKNFGLISHKSFEKSSFFSKVQHAVTSRQPKSVYAPAFYWYWFLTSFFRIIPRFPRVKLFMLLRDLTVGTTLAKNIIEDYKTVLVTNCDYGLGLTVAKELYSMGLTVVAACSSAHSNGFKYLNSSAWNRRRMMTVILDPTSDESVNQGVHRVNKILKGRRADRVSCIVNVPDISSQCDLKDSTWSQIEYFLEESFISLIRVTKAFLDHIRENQGRVIILDLATSSDNEYFDKASNSAIEAFSEGLQIELSTFRVKVCLIRASSYDVSSESVKNSVNAKKLNLLEFTKMCLGPVKRRSGFLINLITKFYRFIFDEKLSHSSNLLKDIGNAVTAHSPPAVYKSFYYYKKFFPRTLLRVLNYLLE